MGESDNKGGSPSKSGKEISAKELGRYEWGARVREVEEGPDGYLYVLEDGEDGRLLRVSPAK